ncbi:Uncharacterized protein dnm_041230 [Desulfonema magnum]|uniref:Uncharacterized protein n=1 Tax=Desulfonema magnum TaxID=45655 RepID=A0A975BMN4_9BACT|nr:Uncharacterized protein dnm_041230 [Desulfonema magnum]
MFFISDSYLLKTGLRPRRLIGPVVSWSKMLENPLELRGQREGVISDNFSPILFF